MSDEAAVAAQLAALYLEEKSGTAGSAIVTLGPFTAWSLIAALQLAWRHPEMSGMQRELIEGFARQLQPLFRGDLAEALDAGWDTARDVPAGDAGLPGRLYHAPG